MKFQTSDIPKMALATLATAAVFIIFLYRPRPVYEPSKSARISWGEAETLKSDYMGFKPMMVEYDDHGNKVIAKLQGFVMNAQQIDEVINHNKNGPTGDDKADDMMIYFGMDKTFMSGHDELPNLKIIVAGIKDGVIMKNPHGNSIDDSSVFDRADPCPPNTVTIPN